MGLALADTTGLFVVASAPAGWYDVGDGARRWFDGRQWTDHYAPRLSLVPDLDSGVHSDYDLGHDHEDHERTRFPTDHGFHLIMVIMTLGCWAPVWVAATVLNRVRRTR